VKKTLPALVLLAAATMVAAWGFIFWRSIQAEKVHTTAVLPPGAETVSYLVYYPGRTGLEPVEESRQREKPASALARLRAVVDEMHVGPTVPGALPMLPPGLKPRAVFLTPDGTAFIDEPAALFERLSGVREEFVFIRSMARTLLRNCPEVKAFVLLSDGSSRLRLFSHLMVNGRYILPRGTARAGEAGALVPQRPLASPTPRASEAGRALALPTPRAGNDK